MKWNPPRPGQLSMRDRAKLGGRGKTKPKYLAAERLADMEVDPLMLSAQLAMGKGTTQPHPASRLLRDHLAAIRSCVGREDYDELPAILAEMDQVIASQLDEGYVEPSLRSKHIIDLMQYVYPKLRAIDNTTTVATYDSVENIPDDVLWGIVKGTVDPDKVAEITRAAG